MMKKNTLIGAFVLTAVTVLAFTGCPGTGSPALSGEKRILSFTVTVGGRDARGNIDEPNRRITLVLFVGTDVTALAPVIALPEKATVVPASGVPKDFTNPVMYRVTAEDTTTQDYTVTAIVPLPLDEAVEAAKNAAAEVVVSVDGSDVDEGKAWVSRAEMDALNEALEEAGAMLADPEATEAEKEGAARALALALARFNEARGMGTKQVTEEAADKTALHTAIAKAESAGTGVVVDTAAANVAEGTLWVTQAVLDTFTAAINAAKTLAGKNSPTQAELDTAETALKAATNTFAAARQTGTKPAPGTLALTLDPPEEFTDLPQGVVDQGSAVKIYREGVEDTSLTVTVDTTGLETAAFEWRLDNEPAGTGLCLTLEAKDHLPGSHHLSLEVTITDGEGDKTVWSRELTVIVDSGSKQGE